MSSFGTNNIANKTFNETSPPPTFITQVNMETDRDRPKTPYEDRLIPTLRNNRSRLEKLDNTTLANGRMSVNAAPTIEEAGAANTSNGAIEEQEVFDPSADGTEEMTERDIREAAQMNDYLGKQIVCIALSTKT